MVAFMLSALLIVSPLDQDNPVPPNGAAPPAAPAAAEEPEDDDPVICRSRLVPSSRIGERNRRVQTCKARSEWAADSRSRMRR